MASVSKHDVELLISTSWCWVTGMNPPCPTRDGADAFLMQECSVCLYSCMPEGPFLDGHELPCGCWELNPAPLEGRAVFLTAAPSSLQHPLLPIPQCFFLRWGMLGLSLA